MALGYELKETSFCQFLYMECQNLMSTFGKEGWKREEGGKAGGGGA